ncbi:unnamed protein product [Albugo candida]|uniref:Uncharacterized protein n=1 Tax=Albugo candida TaxID=65357 RepID=A0A024GTD0_9STRA|nr:unnamed protein product [Albugo candida]|eukprot:CCI49616.1 unnamed protein product [Albugo candida]
MDYRLPGNSDSNGFHQGFRLQIVNQYTPIYRSSEIPDWVLGAEILRTVKISINTMDGEKMLEASPYENFVAEKSDSDSDNDVFQ